MGSKPKGSNNANKTTKPSSSNNKVPSKQGKSQKNTQKTSNNNHKVVKSVVKNQPVKNNHQQSNKLNKNPQSQFKKPATQPLNNRRENEPVIEQKIITETPKTDLKAPEPTVKVAKRKKRRYIPRILIILVIGALSLGGYFIFRPKFKDLTIELGIDTVSIDDFLTNKKFKKASEIKTDITEIDFSKVAEYDIKLVYKNKEKIVKLKIVDTTAPMVVFKNVIAYLDYQMDANEFIEEKTDLSEMIVSASQVDGFNEFKDYSIKITVEDKYGNQTSKDCILTISWLKPLVYIELGNPFTMEDVIVNMEKDADKMPQSEIEKVDPLKIGEYMLTVMYEDKEYQSQVIVQDTMPPELELKDITIFVGDKIKSIDKFIKSVKDASGEVTTTMKTEIDYTILGTQKITIEATDIHGNKVEKTASLTIKKDTNGPVFSGVGSLTIQKNSSIDFEKGVKAVDAKDGVKKFNVDSSKVNTSTAGTYYAVYTSVDNDGNKTTIKRKITVLHNQDDTNQKFNEFYNKYLAGKSVSEMITVIRTKITYNSNGGGSDPIWYGLTNGAGNCYVHAMLAKKALDKAGINNRLIYVKNKTHYWNLVEISGVWRHYDSTPGSHIKGPATDAEKFASSGMQGRDWDRDAFPKAV